MRGYQTGRAHGLPNTQRIVDATNTPNYGIGLFLPKLLNPLKQNEHSVKDFFDAVK